MLEDKVKSISKKDEFDNIRVDNQRILQAIHKIKAPGRYQMNIFNNYTDLNTTVSAAAYKCSDVVYITIPEQGRIDNTKNDNIINYLPTKKIKDGIKKC